MENVGNFRGQLLNMKEKQMAGQVLDYKDAYNVVEKDLKEKSIKEMDEKRKEESKEKTKEYLRERRELYRGYVRESVTSNGFSVIGYRDNMDDFINEVVEEFVGYSVLAPYMEDPDIDNVYVVAWNNIWIERNNVNEKVPTTFNSEKHFRDTLTRFLNSAETEINSGDKRIVHFELYGDRGCATDKTVSSRGTSLTLRKHKEEHITLDQLLDWDLMTNQMADFLGMLIKGESNIIIAGITGSGKTTTLRALIDHNVTKLNKRMLVVEDTQELFPLNDHTVELISIKNDDSTLAVTLNDLIMTALRLQPKYIVVGEVRGVEAVAAVEAMETGHSTIFSMHGGTVWNVINRLVTKYVSGMSNLGIEVVERIIGSAVDYIAIQSDIPGVGKRITEIVEVAYDYRENRITIKTIFKFNNKTKNWDLLNKISPDKADFMVERGVPYEEVESWIED